MGNKDTYPTLDGVMGEGKLLTDKEIEEIREDMKKRGEIVTYQTSFGLIEFIKHKELDHEE